MEEQVDAGRAKTIGLSNFSIEQIENVWKNARIKPVCLQVRIQLTWQQSEFIEYCHTKKIVVVGYSSLRVGGPGPGPRSEGQRGPRPDGPPGPRPK